LAAFDPDAPGAPAAMHLLPRYSAERTHWRED